LINHGTGKHSLESSGVMAALAGAAESVKQNQQLNFQHLQDNLGKAAALEVLNTFVSYTTDAVDELRACLQRHDAGRACTVIREMKRSCAIVGAGRLLRCLHLLEGAFSAADRENIQICVDNVAREALALRHEAGMLN
jgi:HPt (histidine-containing phosphotransfer) domain-containing protein